jgi:hypothetical protein
MVFEWDEAKSRRNARERGLPFEFAIPLFDGPTLELPDERRDYGERPLLAIGVVDGRTLACIYTDRDDARRIISVRVASREERDGYRAAYPS